MISFLRRLFRREPRVWAVQIWTVWNGTANSGTWKWFKVVSVCRPCPSETPGMPFIRLGVQGPFRSEVDCDEFCKAANGEIPEEKPEQKEDWQ